MENKTFAELVREFTDGVSEGFAVVNDNEVFLIMDPNAEILGRHWIIELSSFLNTHRYMLYLYFREDGWIRVSNKKVKGWR
jgi:hypothetical protein